MKTEIITAEETEIVEPIINMGERGEPTEHTEPYQFDVVEEPVTAGGLIVPNMRAIINGSTQEVIGTVGSHYKVLSHSAALDPLLKRLNDKGVKTFKRINMTNGGARMYANVYFPGNELAIGDQGSKDNVWPGITVVNSLDGALKFSAEATLYRLACTNGMRIPTKMAAFSARHSKNQDFDSMVEHILEFVADGSQFSTFQRLANHGMKVDGIESIIDGILKDKASTFPARYKDMVMGEIMKTDTSFNTVTAWDLYNAFQSVIEHHLIREKGKLNRGRTLEDNLFKYFSNNYGKVIA